jgi:serine phosphatase RsbU (regulator of sigma subunit)
MQNPIKKIRLHSIFIVLLFLAGFGVSTFFYYARVRGAFINEMVILGALSLVFYTSFTNVRFDEMSITRKLRVGLVLLLLIYVVGFVISFALQPEFKTPKPGGPKILEPNSFSAVLVANVIGMVALVCLVVLLRLSQTLIFHRRKKNTQNHFFIFIFLSGLTILSATLTGKPLRYDPSSNHIVTFILLILTTIFMSLNALRVGWVTVLNRRQKLITFLGGILFTFVTAGLLGATIGSGITFSDMVESYSFAAGSFMFIVTIFVFLYSVATTVNTLLHLPTAAIYDKKVREINSFYSLSRTINSLFDFDKIIVAVTDLVCEATNAQACWLEMSHAKNPSFRTQFDFVALKTRDNFHVHFLELSSKKYLKKGHDPSQFPSNDLDYLHYLMLPVETILQTKQPFIINQVKRDKLTKDLKRTPIESLVGVPLISNDEIVGIIYAAKSQQFGFDQDDIAIISAFANQTTVALENTRLVKESIEKERMEQELRIAHEVQMKLIPQQIPVIKNDTGGSILDVGAMTLPANEVGGDYYDFVKLTDWRMGIVVADVSGKGTSAAFYMAEIKGIIQALAGIYSAPKDLLIAVNEVLFGSMDRKSFITLLYADFDMSKNELRFARAGHCPLLHMRGDKSNFIRPDGIGLGLDNGLLFRNSINEHVLSVDHEDIFVMYSDGLIEARNLQGEEFGEDRLCKAVHSVQELDAQTIKDKIIQDINHFSNGAKAHDDLTCVVLKLKEVTEQEERRVTEKTAV